MTPPMLMCGGNPLILSGRIGRGGEGEIFALADGSGRAVKLYHNPDSDHEAKVAALIAKGLDAACSNVAFPMEIVRYQDGRFAGFTMQRIEGHQPVHELITPASRRDLFPSADFRFLIHVAGNVARIVASVHAAGVVIGDINTSGFLVSQRGTVTLIDADSVQIDAYRCRVGTPECTPPELQNVPFGTIDRTANHDAFGLAVILFELLALGRHPYAGVARGRTLPLEQAIVQGRFVYSLLRKVSAAQPPATLWLSELTRTVGLLFERAFAGKGEIRPTAAEWVAALRKLSQSVSPCPRFSSHFMVAGATSCPWCRIERQTGRAIFASGVAIPPASRPGSRSPLSERAKDTIQHAKRHAGEALMPMWSRASASPSKGARKALDAIGSKAARLPPAIRAFQFGRSVLEKYSGRVDAAQRGAVRALDRWRVRLGVMDIANLIGSLRDHGNQLERVDADRSMAITRVAAQIRSYIALRLLEREKIASATIPGIGAAVKAHLAAHGIENAAHLSRSALTAIGGIGEARIVSLLFWAEALKVKAEEEALTKDCDEVAVSAAARVEQAQIAIEQQIEALTLEIDMRVARVRKAVWLVDREVEAALAALDQATVDLEHLGLSALDCSTFLATAGANVPAPKSNRKSSKKRSQRACPRCGSTMVPRWGQPAHGKQAIFLGCTKYPICTGTAPFGAKTVKP